MKDSHLKAPFPYFGGKSKIAQNAWLAMGDVGNYVEPFFGSGAMLLARPDFDVARHIETVNDKDGLVSNFWRAIQRKPEDVAMWADWPINECDLHARHAWHVGEKDTLQYRLEGDPDFYDCKIAGWWVWGMACWIGSGFCSGKGPWQVIDGLLQKTSNGSIKRQRIHLGNAGQGIKRQLVHLGNAGNAGNGEQGLIAWFDALAVRLKRVRVCCGDWSRVLGATPTVKQGLTGIFLDPPYRQDERDKELYRVDEDISQSVYTWAIEHGNDPLLRIVLCGYDGEHDMPTTWRKIEWIPGGGYANLSADQSRSKANRKRERIWLSPHCLDIEQQLDLFAE